MISYQYCWEFRDEKTAPTNYNFKLFVIVSEWVLAFVDVLANQKICNFKSGSSIYVGKLHSLQITPTHYLTSSSFQLRVNYTIV